MKRFFAVAVVACLGVASADPSQAMPLGAIDHDPFGAIVKVRIPCEPGYHRNPYGGCRANSAKRLPCPRGFHRAKDNQCHAKGS
jgi:hypothetical protein